MLVQIGAAHAEFVHAFRDRGILVRDRSSDPGCDGCVRLTVGSNEHTEILISTLREIVEKMGLRSNLPADQPSEVQA